MRVPNCLGNALAWALPVGAVALVLVALPVSPEEPTCRPECPACRLCRERPGPRLNLEAVLTP